MNPQRVSLFALITLLFISQAKSECTEVYTTGDDEVCHVNLLDLNETCVTFNSSYNIASTTGFGMHPLTGELYIMASIGSNNGDRKLFLLNGFDRTNNNISDYDGTLTELGLYNDSNEKIAAMTFGWGSLDDDYYDISLYGITGAQADHSLYTLNYSSNGDGELMFLADIDISDEGNGMTFDYTRGVNGKIYRLSGNRTLNLLDIEEIDPDSGEILYNDYINATTFGIGTIRSIGYFVENYTFLVDQSEDIYLVNVYDGDDVTSYGSLSGSRKHKGIICTNALIDDTTTTTPPTTTTPDIGTDTDAGVNQFGSTLAFFTTLVVAIRLVMAVMFV